MKNLVWLAGLLLVVAFLFPNGVKPLIPAPTPVPAPAPAPAPVPVVPVVQPDATIVGLLANAEKADKKRIRDVYSSLITILTRDNGKFVKTTEQWAVLQDRTLTLAIDKVGKYPKLDEAIENVFVTTVGTDDVLPANEETQKKLISACEIIVLSAK